MDGGAVRLRRVILAALLLAATVAGAADIYVELGTAVSNVTLACAISKTSAPPNTIWIKPGTYPAFNAINQHTGTIRSISGQLTGYGSAQDTIIDAAWGASAVDLVANTTLLGVRVVKSAGGSAFGNSDGGVRTAINCQFESNVWANYGSVASPNSILSNCIIRANGGIETLYRCDIYNSLIIGNYNYGTYASVYSSDAGTHYLVGNTFFANKITGNGEIYHYAGTLYSQNNLIVTTNAAYAGIPTLLGGDVSQSVANAASIFRYPTSGEGTNLPAGGDYRLVPLCAAWSAGVFTAATTQARTDLDGMNWRGLTNNAAGAYWQNPTMIPQLRGGLIL